MTKREGGGRYGRRKGAAEYFTSSLHNNSSHSSGGVIRSVSSMMACCGKGSIFSAIYAMIFLARNMRLALRREFLCVDTYC